MSLTEMSFFGGIMIAVIIIVRALALHRLPKRVFCILWGLAVLRLLTPFSVPSPLRIQALPEPSKNAEISGIAEIPLRPAAVTPEAIAPAYVSVDLSRTKGLQIPVRLTVWGTGTALCTAFFAVSYVRGRRKFAGAETVGQAEAWLMGHPLKRPLAVRQCSEIAAPLTYGILRPVILTPVGMEWTEQTAYVLEHEFVHVQRFDAAAKLILTAAVCVHWCNPLVWAMYVLANRDIELSCDEAVVRRFGLGKRSAYALTLIGMEEQKSSLPPLASCFSKNAIEERIRAIMKIKKTSALAVLLAAVLVCMVSAGFALSGESGTEDLREYLKKIELPSAEFNKNESQRLFSLWFEGYENMTVAAYQEKMWTERDTPEDIELIERYAKSLEGATYRYFDDQKANEALDIFREYYCNVYEPLTAERWKHREFSGHALHDGIKSHLPTDPDTPAMNALLEYTFALEILDAEKLTVGEYETAKQDVKTVMTALLWERTREELKDSAYMETLVEQEIKNLEDRLSTGSLQVQITGYVFMPVEDESEADAELYRQSSEETGQQWDELLSPYLPFGLTYEFDDPDHDGNGLKMYYQGREVQGITDEQKKLWITEHTGTSFAPDAVELYAVYENGKLAGLRTATAAEQAEWDAIRQSNADTRPNPLEEHRLLNDEEQREFSNGTAKDYVSFLELMKWEEVGLPEYASSPYRNYQDMTLEMFNSRLLEWANENQDAYDRIMCDVIWNDYQVSLSDEEKRFVSLTANLSGTENGMAVRSSYTGRPEEDPSFSVQFPERMTAESGITVAWVDFYYRCSYHISDKSAVRVRERDACISGFMESVQKFWSDTDMDTLLGMTEEQAADRLNQIAAEYSTDKITIHPLTVDDIQLDTMDERGIN